MKTKATVFLIVSVCASVLLSGCSGGGKSPDAAKQAETAKENFSKLPPEVKPGNGPGK